MKQVFFLLFPICFSAASVGCADPFDSALRASEEGHHGKAAAAFHTLARDGDGVAAYNLALLFATGRGVPQNDREARYWAWRARLADVSAASRILTRLWPPDDVSQRKEIADRLEADLQPLVAAGDGAAMLQLAAVLLVVRENPDVISGHSWQSIAAALDVPGAVSARDATLESLHGADRAKAQEQALATFRTWCMEQHPLPPACGIMAASGPNS